MFWRVRQLVAWDHVATWNKNSYLAKKWWERPYIVNYFVKMSQIHKHSNGAFLFWSCLQSSSTISLLTVLSSVTDWPTNIISVVLLVNFFGWWKLVRIVLMARFAKRACTEMLRQELCVFSFTGNLIICEWNTQFRYCWRKTCLFRPPWRELFVIAKHVNWVFYGDLVLISKSLCTDMTWRHWSHMSLMPLIGMISSQSVTGVVLDWPQPDISKHSWSNKAPVSLFETLAGM